jgi:hypothetical protein
MFAKRSLFGRRHNAAFKMTAAGLPVLGLDSAALRLFGIKHEMSWAWEVIKIRV